MADEEKNNQGGSEQQLEFSPEVMRSMQRHKEKQNERKAKRIAEQPPFLITSLMDAMTILLTFLLITLTADPLNIKQDSHLLLAKSTAVMTVEDAIPVTVRKSYISVDTEDVVKVECKMADGRICDPQIIERNTFCDQDPAECSPQELEILKSVNYYVDKSYKEEGDDRSLLIIPLFKKLDEKVRALKEENAALNREYKGKVNIICDRSIPYRLVAEIVNSAGQAELHDIRFAIIYTTAR